MPAKTSAAPIGFEENQAPFYWQGIQIQRQAGPAAHSPWTMATWFSTTTEKTSKSILAWERIFSPRIESVFPIRLFLEETSPVPEKTNHSMVSLMSGTKKE
jgi:hypothetical protein